MKIVNPEEGKAEAETRVVVIGSGVWYERGGVAVSRERVEKSEMVKEVDCRES